MSDEKFRPKRIYLIGADLDTLWCEDPDPDVGMDEKDATPYIRADLVERVMEKIEYIVTQEHHGTMKAMLLVAIEALTALLEDGDE